MNDFKAQYNAALGNAKLQLDGYKHDDKGFEANNNTGNRLDAFWEKMF